MKRIQLSRSTSSQNGVWVITSPTKIKSAFHSIRLKFILAYLLIIMFAFAVAALALTQLVGESLFAERGREYLSRAQAYIPAIGASYAGGKTDAVYDSLMRLSNDLSCRAVLLDENGVVRADSLSELNGTKTEFGNSFDIESFTYLKSEKSPVNTGGACLTVILCRLDFAGGRVVCAFDSDPVLAACTDTLLKLACVMGAVLALSILLGLLITRSYARPVKQLSSAMGKLSAGDFTVRVPEEGKSELAELTRAFNDMIVRMETLDRSRNQFVSNASHELKTPMATIKILVQTLLYQEVYDAGMTNEFLGDIDKEIDRLTAVVGDLLTLVGMDSGAAKLKTEKLDITALVVENVKRLSPLARERGIELEGVGGEALEITGDRTKLDQVFYNLIDNAIKYTPRGEGVSVSVSKQSRFAVIKVSDNGIGIPEGDLVHIFDRFYRVDKARSRETGGTGLGLSIVKQIILAHGGTIDVSSKVNKGSVFTVKLPLGLKIAGGAHE